MNSNFNKKLQKTLAIGGSMLLVFFTIVGITYALVRAIGEPKTGADKDINTVSDKIGKKWATRAVYFAIPLSIIVGIWIYRG